MAKHAKMLLPVVVVVLMSCAPKLPAATSVLVPLTSTQPGPAATAATLFPEAAVQTPTLAEPTPTVSYQQWPAPPAMAIDPTKIYIATFKTARGDIVVQLLADKAPLTVNNFIFLAKNKFYDNTTFHRVIAGEFAQGGDPSASGRGGPGYEFGDEFNPDLRFEEPGLLAMANAGPDTNGSQFFITVAPEPQLTGRHTIFGKVISGLEVAKALTARDPQQNPAGPGDGLITVEISEVATSQLPPPTATPAPLRPTPAPGRPLSKLDPAARTNLFNTAPAMVISTSQSYSATIKTTQGDIVVALYPAEAPQAVNNFVVLADLGYWDNFPVDFTNPGQFFLTGSPAGQPSSDIGYVLPDEIKRPNAAGAVGFWYRADRFGPSGSEFYVLLIAAPALDQHFTVFGQVTDGLTIAGLLTTTDRILSVTIHSS